MKLLFFSVFLFCGTYNSISQEFGLDSKDLNVGDIYICEPRIEFDFGKWTIKSTSHAHLDSIAEFLKENENLTLEISTHTDSRASQTSSSNLGYKRAISIVEYLVSKGVNPDNLVAKSYGQRYLRVSDDQINILETDEEKEAAHALNRRVELKIIEIKN